MTQHNLSQLLLRSSDVSIRGNDGSIQVSSLTADSRTVRSGALFAALSGIKSDGAEYIGDAMAKGAVAILGRPELADKVPDDIGFVAADNPRRALAEIAAQFYETQPEMVAAVTGTNGKTSVVNFCRQLWKKLEVPAACLGTLGLTGPDFHEQVGATSPDPILLHRLLSEVNVRGIDHLAIEASSHGLDQHRLDGVRIAVAGFTNISRDHLDYHFNMESYFEAKARLFTQVMRPDGIAVLNADHIAYDILAQVCKQRRVRVLSYGKQGRGIRLISREPRADGQVVTIQTAGQDFHIDVPLVGEFQIYNLMCAIGMVSADRFPIKDVIVAAKAVTGIEGRLQLAGKHPDCGAPVYIDYAHTPDALENILHALRPHCTGRLVVAFGCGGDRDPGKRPEMGLIAAKLADHVIITDDNPRTENPQAIRTAILANCPEADEIPDRTEAIALGIAGLNDGDIFVIAGKGHETGQIIGTETLPFSDLKTAQTTLDLLGAPADLMGGVG